MSNQDFFRGKTTKDGTAAAYLKKDSNQSSNQKVATVEKKAEDKKESKAVKKVHLKLLPENGLFTEVLGKKVLLTMKGGQLNIKGQTFQPVFTGKVVEVTNGYITLDHVTMKQNNESFYEFPSPLSFIMENISSFVPFEAVPQVLTGSEEDTDAI